MNSQSSLLYGVIIFYLSIMLYYVTIIIKSCEKFYDSKLLHRIEKHKFFFFLLTNIGRKLLIVDKK